jgi:hypothetical protein
MVFSYEIIHTANIFFQPTLALCVALYHIFVVVLWTHEVIGGRAYIRFFYRRGQSSIPNDICGWIKTLAQLLLVTYRLNKATYWHSAILDTILSKVPIAQLNKPQENCRNKERGWENKAGKFAIGLLIATSRMPVFCDVRLSLDVSKEISAFIFKGWECKEDVAWTPQPSKWKLYISSKVGNTDVVTQLLIRIETDLQWNRFGNLKSHILRFVCT